MHFKVSKPSVMITLCLSVSAFIFAGCSEKSESFSAWVNSDKPLAKTQEIARKRSAPLVSYGDEIEVLKVVGDGSDRPFVALEKYFSSLPGASIEERSEQSGALAKMFATSITYKVKLKKTAADSPIIFERLWIFQLFRTLPLETRITLLKSPLADPFRDPASPGDLLQVEGKGTERQILELRNHFFASFESAQMRAHDAFLFGVRRAT
jgi:hypothetical protein